MKNIYILFVLTLVLMSSCEEDNKVVLDNTGVNSWLHQTMKDRYLWGHTIPNIEATDIGKQPIDYFNSQLRYRTTAGSDYSADTYGDRFSRLTELSQSRAADAYLGMDDKKHDFGLGLRYFVGSSTGNYEFLQVVYVVPFSPAYFAGIKRGDRINKINDVAMPNYSGAIQNEMSQEQMTVSIYSPESKVVALNRADFYDTPVIFDSIFDTDPKTAYLVYNHFTTGVGERYLNELNAVFNKFKNAGVRDLILDLRYNGGGELTVARHLASLMARKELLGQRFIYKEGRASFGRSELFTAEDFIKNVGDIEANNIDAQNICILSSKNTASASELIIHAFKPYYQGHFMLIGERTVGKNLGSTEQPNSRYLWKLNPITMRVYDCNFKSGYENGIDPDQGKVLTEYNDYQNHIGGFGNSLTEPLLRTALSAMHPERFQAMPATPMSSRHGDRYVIFTDVSRQELIDDQIKFH